MTSSSSPDCTPAVGFVTLIFRLSTDAETAATEAVVSCGILRVGDRGPLGRCGSLLSPWLAWRCGSIGWLLGGCAGFFPTATIAGSANAGLMGAGAAARGFGTCAGGGASTGGAVVAVVVAGAAGISVRSRISAALMVIRGSHWFVSSLQTLLSVRLVPASTELTVPLSFAPRTVTSICSPMKASAIFVVPWL